MSLAPGMGSTQQLLNQLEIYARENAWLSVRVKELEDQIMQAEVEQIPDVLFDGNAVYSELTDREKRRTSPENVSDVLDAVVRILRKEK